MCAKMAPLHPWNAYGSCVFLLSLTNIKTVPGLKSQLGDQLEYDFNAQTLTDLQKISFNNLLAKYGKKKARRGPQFSKR